LGEPSIALVSQEFPPDSIGGIGSYTHYLASLLSERKVPTTVYCGKARKILKERFNDYLTVIRLPIFEMPLRAYWFQFLNYSLFRQSLQHFDVVHAVNPHSSAVCALVKQRLQPMVTTMHYVPVYKTKAFFNSPAREWTIRDFLSNFVEMSIGERLCALTFRESQKIVSVSQTVRRQARVAYGDILMNKVTVIPNGIPFASIQRELLKCKTEDDEEFILNFGRLVTFKGIPLLFRAIALLRKRFPNIKLRVVGKGPLYPKLQIISHELGIGENVKFYGYLRRQELMSTIKNCLFVVLPSYHEGAGIAALEAMACEKPVVALNYPISREIIKDFETGLLALPGDEVDLARKIEMLIEDKDLRTKLGRAGRTHVYQNYNWDKLIDLYVALYRSLAEQL